MNKYSSVQDLLFTPSGLRLPNKIAATDADQEFAPKMLGLKVITYQVHGPTSEGGVSRSPTRDHPVPRLIA